MPYRFAFAIALVFVVFDVFVRPLAVTAQEAPEATMDEEARSLFEAGRMAFEVGRFEAALAHFQRAHELSGRGVLLYNIGVALDRLRRDDEALEAFRGYLAAVPDAMNAEEVQARIALLESTHAAAALPPPLPQAIPDPLPPAAPDPPTVSSGGVSIAAVTGFTLAGLGLVSAAVFGGLALASDDSLWSSCGTSCTDAQVSELATYTLVADVSLGIAAAAAIAGVLGLLLEDTSHETSVAIVPTADGALLALAGALP